MPKSANTSKSNPATPNHSNRFASGFRWGLLSMLIAVMVLPLIIAVTGFVNVSAQHSFGPIDALLGFASDRSVGFHASKLSNPYANNSQALVDALPHYKEMCFVCHGAPGLANSEIAEGMHPAPPDLSDSGAQKMSDGEIFWIINHGVGSTGMPAFEGADDADTLWKIVTFVRHLPDLTDAERQQLKPDGEEEE